MAAKLCLAAMVSLVAVCYTSAAPLTATSTSPVLFDAVVRFRRSASSPEESVLVTFKRANEGGLRVGISECPLSIQSCHSGITDLSTGQTGVRRKRTINMNILLQILRAILKLFGIRIPDPIFDLLTGTGRNKSETTTSASTSSNSSSGALNLEALLG